MSSHPHYDPIHRPVPRRSTRMLFWILVAGLFGGILWWGAETSHSSAIVRHHIAYHGGLVLYQPRVYTIYDDPAPTPADAREHERITQFLEALPDSRYLAPIRVYQRRAARPGSDPALGLAAYDPARQSATVGACPTSPCQIGAWIVGIAQRHHWPIGTHSIFVIFLPRGRPVKALSPETDLNTLGYHTAWTAGSGPPLLGAVVTGADAPVPHGAVHPGQIAILTHELIETITDPLPRQGWIATSASCGGAGWSDCGDREIADVCQFGYPNGVSTRIGRETYPMPLYAGPDGACTNGFSLFNSAGGTDTSPDVAAATALR